MEQKQMSIEEHIEKGAILKPQVVYRPTFEKEVTLRDVVQDFAKKQGVVLKNVDETARNLLFSIDGVIKSSIAFGGVAKMLDIVVKPHQKIEVMPAIKAG